MLLVPSIEQDVLTVLIEVLGFYLRQRLVILDAQLLGDGGDSAQRLMHLAYLQHFTSVKHLLDEALPYVSASEP